MQSVCIEISPLKLVSRLVGRMEWPEGLTLRKSRDKVQVTSDRGMLRLRWTYIDKRYSLSLGLEDTRSNRTHAQGIARQIAEDIRCGQCNITKNKYCPKIIGNCGLICSELFDKFTTHKQRDFGISARSVETRYIPLSRALEKWLHIPLLMKSSNTKQKTSLVSKQSELPLQRQRHGSDCYRAVGIGR